MKYFFLFFAASFISTVNAQELEENTQYGLILSGGGAKGISHVGLLKAIEEQGIRLNAITGTSIGALVGGFYACGYSPNQIEKLILSNELVDATSGSIPKKQKQAYVSQSWAKNVFFTLRFHKKKNGKLGLTLRRSLINSTGIDLLLMKYLARCNEGAAHSFDSLFVKYRANASSVQSRKEYIPEKGSITDIVRASITFPFYIPPITIKNKIMFDGGIYNNFLYEVMDTVFQPHIILGSLTSNPKEQEFDIHDPINQIQNLIVKPTDYSPKEKNVYLIDHELSDYELFGFEKSEELIEIGYRNTLQNLFYHNLSDNKYQQITRERIPYLRKNKRKVIYRSLSFLSLSKNQERFIRRRFLFSKKNLSYTFYEIKEISYHLLSHPIFENIRPTPVFNSQTNSFSAEIETTINKYPQLSFSGNLGTESHNHLYTELNYSFLRNYLASFLLGIKVGQRNSSIYSYNRFDYVLGIPLFTELTVAYSNSFFRENKNSLNLTGKNNILRTLDFSNGISLGVPLSKKNYFKATVSNIYVRSQYAVFDSLETLSVNRSEELERRDFFSGEKLTTEFVHTSISSKYGRKVGGEIAFSGNFFLLSNSTRVDKLLANSNRLKVFEQEGKKTLHARIKLRIEKYFMLNRDVQSKFQIQSTWSDLKTLSTYDMTTLYLPSYLPSPFLSDFFRETFRAKSFGAISLFNRIRLYKSFHFHFNYSFFLPFESFEPDEKLRFGFSTKQKPFEILNFQSMFHFVFALNTPIAPVSAQLFYTPKTYSYFLSSTYNKTPENEISNLYFVLTFGFPLPGKKIFLKRKVPFKNTFKKDSHFFYFIVVDVFIFCVGFGNVSPANYKRWDSSLLKKRCFCPKGNLFSLARSGF